MSPPDVHRPAFLYQYRDSCADLTSNECAYGVVRMDGAAKEPVATDLSAALTYLRPECVGRPTALPPLAVIAELAPGWCWCNSWAVRSLVSPDGRFRLRLQTDGNLVLYKNDTTVVWASGTKDGMRLLNQLDGNIVLYRANGTAAWSTGTWTHGPATLLLQDDGNLVLYRIRDRAAIWSNGTSSPGSR